MKWKKMLNSKKNYWKYVWIFDLINISEFIQQNRLFVKIDRKLVLQ